MTLTVIIGKMGSPSDEIPNIGECPEESHDVCDPEYTIFPKRAIRIGSSDMRDFFDGLTAEIYTNTISDPTEIIQIKPVIDVINDLADDLGDAGHNDRMKWLKFWCNRAVELYGDEAGIEFC